MHKKELTLEIQNNRKRRRGKKTKSSGPSISIEI
jgi:hypothetical protein